MTVPAPPDGRWKTDGACTQVIVTAGADPWFPDTQHSATIWDRPRAICQECPVRDLCLAAAMDAEAGNIGKHTRHGMWGGLTPAERIALAKATTDKPSKKRRTA